METRDIRLTHITEDNWGQDGAFEILRPLVQEYFLSGGYDECGGPFTINICGEGNYVHGLCEKCPRGPRLKERLLNELIYSLPTRTKGPEDYRLKRRYYLKDPFPPKEFFYRRGDPPKDFIEDRWRNWYWELPSLCEIILVNDRPAAAFCPEHQILCTSDWTRNKQCAFFAQFLFLQLIQDLDLKKVQRLWRLKFPGAEITLGCAPIFEELEWPDRYSPIPPTLKGDNFRILARSRGKKHVALRPEPSSQPLGLARNVVDLMEQIDVPLSVKGDTFSVAGPLYFGIPQEARTRGVFVALTTVLDDFLGNHLSSLAGKVEKAYIRPGVFAVHPEGFEYRSLPAAYYADRRATEIVYKVAYNAVTMAIRQGRLTYSAPPTREDYGRIAGLTDDEYDYLFTFIERYPEGYSGTAINAQWRRSPLILFRNWGSESCYDYEELPDSFQTYVLERFKAFDVPGVVVMYSLDRCGQVIAGITVPGYQTVPHTISIADDEIVAVGIPRDFLYPPDPKTREQIDRVCDAVRRELIKRARGKERIRVTADTADIPDGILQ